MPRGPKALSSNARFKVYADREKKILEACKDLEDQKFTTISKAASHHNVKYDTLRRRFLNLNKSRYSAQKGSLLNDAEEAALCDWILYLATSAHALCKRTVIPKVQALGGQSPSRTWMRAFLSRHPEIIFGRPTGLDPKRARAFNPVTVQHHFDLLKNIIDTEKIPWQNIWNMDEKGLQLGGGRKGRRTKYFFPRNKRPKYKIQSDDMQLVTCIECVSANGVVMNPGFVFAGVGMYEEWLTEDGILVATSENGWTSDLLCEAWFSKHFIPATKKLADPNFKILLLYDGHGSHVAAQMIEVARQHDIILFCLPPHTTHKLQPLDVGVFGPLQVAWQRCCDDITEKTGQKMELRYVVKYYMEVHRASVSATTILQAWKNCGIRPPNPKIFTEDDYAPSHGTSRKAHFPKSFPVKMPAFLDLSSDDFEYLPDQVEAQYNSSDESDSSDELDSVSDDNDFYAVSDTDEDKNSESDTEVAVFPPNVGTPVPETPRNPFGDVTASIINTNLNSASQQGSFSESTPIRTRSRSTVLEQSYRTNSLSTILIIPQEQRLPPLINRMTGSSHKLTTDQLQAEILYLQKQNERLSFQRDAAEAHCVLAMKQNGDLQSRLNAKTSKPTTRRIYTTARVLTSEEGRAEAAAQSAERAARDAAALETRTRKEAAETERMQQRIREQDTKIYGGALNSKSKEDLLDILFSFRITHSNTHSKAELIELIVAHMDSHPELNDNPRFKGLFTSRARALKKSSALPNGQNQHQTAQAPVNSQQIATYGSAQNNGESNERQFDASSSNGVADSWLDPSLRN